MQAGTAAAAIVLAFLLLVNSSMRVVKHMLRHGVGVPLELAAF